MKKLVVENEGTLDEKSYLYDNDVLSFIDNGDEVGIVLLNAPVSSGDILNVSTYYVDGSLSRKVVYWATGH